MCCIKPGSLTLQELHLGLFGVDTDGIEALGRSHAALDMVRCQGMENAGLPGPIQAQHQYLLAASFTLQSEGQPAQPGQPQGLAGLGETRRRNEGSGGDSKSRFTVEREEVPAGLLPHKDRPAAPARRRAARDTRRPQRGHTQLARKEESAASASPPGPGPRRAAGPAASEAVPGGPPRRSPTQRPRPLPTPGPGT